MIDIHSHLLYGVDDGSETLEDSIELLKKAQSDGITDIILTPHYIRNGEYRLKAKDIIKRYHDFIKEVKDYTDINLYIGNELYIHSELDNMILMKDILSLNNSKYVLVEFPFREYKDDYDEYLYNLDTLGYKIIIAHPERYKYVKDDKNFVRRWTDCGYLLQVNQNSLNKNDTRHMIYDWVAKGYVYFIASDTHNEYRPCILSDAYKNIVKNFNKDVADRLVISNPKCVLEDKDISKMPIVKKKFLGLF